MKADQTVQGSTRRDARHLKTVADHATLPRWGSPPLKSLACTGPRPGPPTDELMSTWAVSCGGPNGIRHSPTLRQLCASRPEALVSIASCVAPQAGPPPCSARTCQEDGRWACLRQARAHCNTIRKGPPGWPPGLFIGGEGQRHTLSAGPSTDGLRPTRGRRPHPYCGPPGPPPRGHNGPYQSNPRSAESFRGPLGPAALAGQGYCCSCCQPLSLGPLSSARPRNGCAAPVNARRFGSERNGARHRGCGDGAKDLGSG